MTKNRLPYWPTRFFKWYCKPQLQEQILGDLEEQFEEDVKKQGSTKAKLKFSWNIIRFIHPKIIKPATGGQKLNYYGMLKNYFTTSIRFIKREKVYALMNISGLALGIACTLIIYKILDHELSYDTHNENYDQIYRVTNEDITPEGKVFWSGQVHPLAEALRNDFPSIKATMTFYEKEGLIGIPNQNGKTTRYQEEDGIVFVEPEFLEIFTLDFLAGDPQSALDQPGKVILTQSIAAKYFGANKANLNEAIGQSIILENDRTVYVSAVVADLPKASDFPFEIIFHYKDQGVSNPWFYDGESWEEYNSATNCYVMLKEGTQASQLDAQLADFVDKYLPEHIAKSRTYRLQALSDLHYSDTIRRTYAGITATKEELIVMGLVGLFLILTACVNFINLSTAQAVKRSKEVGVRKTLGGSKRQLVIQFLCETFLITLFATISGTIIAELMAKPVADIYPYPIDLHMLTDLNLLLFLLPLILVITLLSGLYPSIILSKMNPVLAIKNSLNLKQTSGFLSLRRGLVILQFAISQTLIIGILILNAQMSYFQSKDLGFNDESIVVLKIPENDSTNLSVLKNNLLAHSAIETVSFSSAGPMSSWRSTNPIFHPNIEGQEQFGNLKNVDEDYFNLYEIELIAGRAFTDTDPTNHVVVNRKFTEVLGFQDPADALGEQINYGRGSRIVTIVGVAENFHSASLHSEIDNVFLANYDWNIFQAGVKLKGDQNSYEQIKGAIAHIEKTWEERFPQHVFDFEFYDEQLAGMYELETSVSELFRLFVAIAIIIGALGLYGLVSFMANQKTKEIGIRKVLGASEISICNIFSKELITLLLVAFTISAPVAYFLMRAFLDTYAYRVKLGPQFFILAILVSLVVAVLTVGHKSLKVARANPIDSLKDE
ncbi:FtsX-like permease family protein [Ekhidna sp.]|uniref:FtsX-like permease family protein n=1 Tax=Ekhidna sp. TaxID=2608089 RepID=UPI003CCBA3FD